MTGPASGAVTLNDRVTRNRGALSAEIDGEVVALDIARGACYGLDPVGARIWSMIEEARRVADVCEALMAIYEVDADTCHRDVLDLLAALRAEGLIEVAS
jgi:hypothetical protein